MAKIAFILGHQPVLSYAEIGAVLRLQNIPFTEILRSDDFLIIQPNRATQPTEFARLQNSLGGTVKIAEITKELTNLAELERLLPSQFAALISTKKKINFTISAYGEELTGGEKFQLKRRLIELKEELQQTGSAARYLVTPDFKVSSIVTEDLLRDGLELLLLKTQKRLWLGKTISVQNVRGYRERDADRPMKDLLSGLLPPKVAQMMINLTQTKETRRVFDPFCGNGGILQEAFLLGLEVYGSDISEAAVGSAAGNLKWTAKLKERPLPKLEQRLKVADATKISWPILNSVATIIVTEPHLGPPQRKILLPSYADQVFRELRKLYLDFFKNLAANFPRIKRIGIVLPVARTTAGLKYLDILDDLVQIGYKRKAVLPPETLKNEPLVSKRQGFLYSRPDQFILREMFIFERVGKAIRH